MHRAEHASSAGAAEMYREVEYSVQRGTKIKAQQGLQQMQAGERITRGVGQIPKL
jgi:hypothetical protein